MRVFVVSTYINTTSNGCALLPSEFYTKTMPRLWHLLFVVSLLVVVDLVQGLKCHTHCEATGSGDDAIRCDNVRPPTDFCP